MKRISRLPQSRDDHNAHHADDADAHQPGNPRGPHAVSAHARNPRHAHVPPRGSGNYVAHNSPDSPPSLQSHARRNGRRAGCANVHHADNRCDRHASLPYARSPRHERGYAVRESYDGFA